MAKYQVKRPLQRKPVHPGEILRDDVLPTVGLSVSETARRPWAYRASSSIVCWHVLTPLLRKWP